MLPSYSASRANNDGISTSNWRYRTTAAQASFASGRFDLRVRFWRRFSMMTMIAGVLTRIGEDEVRLRVGSIEYQVLVPESVRRAVQMRLGEEVAFHTLEYI